MTVEALSETGNDRIAMGANMSPFDEVRVEIDDLYEEAKAWLDGTEIASEAEEKAVDQLLDMSRAAFKKAEAARKIENEPYDKGKAAVQAKYKPVLSRAEMISDACKARLTPWRAKIEAERQAKARAAAEEAEKLRREAEEAIRASAGNIEEREKAEEALALAKEADAFAARKQKQAETGLGLRTTYRAELTDGVAAARHYWSERRAECEAFFSSLAAADVRSGKRSIPGFNVIEEKKAV